MTAEHSSANARLHDAAAWVSEMCAMLSIDPVEVRRHRHGRGLVRATPPTEGNPMWAIEVNDDLLRQPTEVQRGVLAHELQHARFDDVWRPSTREARTYYTAVGLIAVTALGVWVVTLLLASSGHPWSATVGAAITALVIWLFLRLCSRRRADNDEQQVVELRNDLAAASLVGRSTAVAGLAWVQSRSGWADRLPRIPILWRLMDPFDTHPAAKDRIRAVKECRLNDPHREAIAFLLHSATQPLRGTRRRRAIRHAADRDRQETTTRDTSVSPRHETP